MGEETPRCAVCAVSVIALQGRACPTCGVVYHHDCWDWVGNCSIFGCQGSSWGRPRPVARPHPVDRPPPTFSMRRLILHNVIVMVVPVMALAVVHAIRQVHGTRNSDEILACLGGACVLYVLFGGLFDSRHPFTYTPRHAESLLIKSRLILSVVLLLSWPAAWFGVVVLQIALAIAMRAPRRLGA